MSPDTSPRRISLFGNFGTGNFGNECTLQAMLCNARRFAPDANISCICARPEDTSSRHNIPASLIKPTLGSRWTASRGPVLRWLRRIVIGLPMEIYRWVQAIGTMMRVDGLVMTGTGMLGDFGIAPLGLHYDIMRWSIAAKVCRRKLLFVSVGAGPIERRLSRWFVKTALSLADYRSYRDGFSKAYLEGIGFTGTGDAVYPDLAFSLPKALVPDGHHDEPRRPVVGIGVMTYYDRRATLDQGGTTYHDYIDTLACLVAWLLEHSYTPRLLIGDATYDDRVMVDLRRLLRQRGLYEDEAIIDEPMASHEEVLSQLAATDYVVASRFHNVLLALMLNKPVLAISYHEKIDALMAGFGLQEYCQDIEHLDLDRLIGQLTALERNAAVLKPPIERTSEAHRKALDSQYHHIFSLVIRPQPSSSERQFATSSTALSS
jgi:polysaccharide pyruvyl transferase WcaK-like protein